MSLWGKGMPKMITRIPSSKRIGPHNINIIEFFYGNLLGKGYLERHGNGIRLCLQQEFPHKDYILWLHYYLSSLNYTNISIPQINSRIGNKGKIRYILCIKTWTYSNLNYLYEKWYKNDIKSGKNDAKINAVMALIKDGKYK